MTEKEKRALEFARKAHRGQKRKGKDEDYISHLIAVHKILKAATKDENVLCAGLLHDVIEDTSFTYEDIKRKFGKKVADTVQEVTKDDEGKFSIRTNEGFIVKCADMLHNIADDNRDNAYLKEKTEALEWMDNELGKKGKNLGAHFENRNRNIIFIDGKGKEWTQGALDELIEGMRAFAVFRDIIDYHFDLGEGYEDKE